MVPHQLALQAPAKVNLALAVAAPDPDTDDQRHPICSWMVPVSLVDDLTFTRLEHGSISRYAILWADDAPKRDDIDWPIRTDLAVRAHLLLQETVGRLLPVQMRIDKRIPLGSGLGGGSSDAAAALRGLNTLFNLSLSDDRLVHLAARLGSDVPFFLQESSAIIHEFGQQVEPIAAPAELHLTLVFPDVACDTATVYRLFDEPETARQQPRGLPAGNVDIRALTATADPVNSALLFNDLLDAALVHQPDLAELMQTIAVAVDTPVHLTGSGSTLFTVSDTASQAQLWADLIATLTGLPTRAVSLNIRQKAASEQD